MYIQTNILKNRNIYPHKYIFIKVYAHIYSQKTHKAKQNIDADVQGKNEAQTSFLFPNTHTKHAQQKNKIKHTIIEIEIKFFKKKLKGIK